MAEFKLGRIRFVWQGNWSSDRAYVADDVISFGGKSYICIRNHTSSDTFNTDFDNEIPKWEIVSDGTKWRGEWEPEVEYAPGDVVKYGSLVYICEIGHTSATFGAPDFLGLEEDLGNWTPFATSFDWKGDWTTDTRFKINDLVRYGGFVYLCNTAHISAATEELGLENDQSNWELFSDGLVYLGEWVTATRYKVNDVVKYGGNVFICTAPHTSNDFLTDETNWDVFIEGFQFEDSWNNSNVYQIGDTVTYGGYVYVAKTNNSAAQPTASPADWEVFTTGFAFQGDWSSIDSYKVGDVVRVGGTTYVAVADSTDQNPPNDTYWSKLNSGINWTNSTETFLQVQGTNDVSSGSGARFDVVKSKTVYTVSVSTGFAGTGYAQDDTILITGDNTGGTTPANDIVVTITGVTAGAVDSVTHTGYSSTWTATTEYVVGDVVIYGASSFICTATHVAQTSNRPDNDLEADYWNLLTLGSEALSLTTEGDMVYYGNQGPTRLPIGVDGQILRATDGKPDWANYGLVDNVVYVGPLGTDEPAPRSGLSIDKPWRSVRYALEQVRDGYLNPQAKQILKNNKQFFKKEITSWLDYTYGVTVTETTAGSRVFTTFDTSNLRDGMPIEFDGVNVFGGVVEGQTYYVDSVISSTTFRIAETQGGISFIPTDATGVMKGKLSYNAAKCERDTGYIVDAMIYDIGRGGTLRTTEAARSYYTEAGNEYITDVFGYQRTQTIEAYEQLKALVAEVLNNEKPVSYQSLMGILIEERASQFIDLSLVSENNAKVKADDLIDIVTIGLEAESNTAIPLPQLPNTTVFIKTGTYNEILPIIIPEYTAIVGDELRTSVIQPQPAIPLLAKDKDKTTSALNRIKEVSEQVIQNITIDATTGNTTPQRYLNGYGGATESTQRLDMSIVKTLNVLEKGVGEVALVPEVGPTPTGGTNNASDSGFANAIAQIEANIDFIVAEQTAWIQAQVDGVIAPFAADFTFDTANCERDTRFILNALRYDLTYGGNFQTTVAARSYFVNGNPVYGTGKKEETLATYTHLKSIVGDVIIEAAITPTPANTEVQDTDGDAGSAAAETFADTRLQEIFDTIDTDGTLPTAVAPDTTWVSNSISSIVTDFTSEKDTLRTSVIDFINSNYGKFTYDSAKCRRDSTILQDGSAYDVALGTNYNSIRNGVAYRRSAGEKVLEDQLTETLGAITEQKSLVAALISDTTAITRSDAYWDELLDIIENNTPNAITWSDPGVAAKTTARSDLQTNRTAIIADVISWIGTNYPNFTYDQTLLELEMGYMIDAISYDVQYGGNSATREVTSAFLTNYIGILPSSQIEVTNEAIDEITTIAATYMTGATEEAEVATLVQIISNAISADDIIALPAATYPDITWATAPIQADTNAIIDDTTVVPEVIQYITNTYSGFVYDHTKCSRDTGYIIDGLEYDILFNSKFNGTKSGMAYRRAISSAEIVIEEQLEATLGAVDHLRREIRDITSRTDKIVASTTTLKDIVVNNNVPVSYTITDPTGYDTGFFNARRLVVANQQFILDEASAYLNTNYNALWTGLTVDEQNSWIDDIDELVEALRYDLTYRGNLETTVRARSYYVDGVFVRPANQKAASIALKERLAAIIDDITTGVSITPSAGNVTAQVTSGTAGSAGAAAFALDRFTEVKNTVDTGILPAAIDPNITWVDAGLQELKSVVDERKSLIQAGSIDYINKMYPTLVYDETKCSRDVGYMIDAVIYDVIFNSNFRSTTAGKSYQRGITSTNVVLADQLSPSVDTIDYVNEALTELTIGVDTTIGQDNAAQEAYNLVKDMTTVIQNGLNSVPPIKLLAPTGYNTSDLVDVAYATTTNTTGDSSTYGNAADQLLANRDFISDELQQWLVDPTNGFDSIWGGLSANAQERCIRDAQFIVDAIRYDITYGGNTQTNVAGAAYFSNFVLTIQNNELAATLASYARLREIIGQIIAETSVTTSPGVTETQDTSGTVGNAAAIEFAQERVDDITYWLNNSTFEEKVEVATEWQLQERKTAYARLVDRKDEIVDDVVYWVEKNHQDLEYNQATCKRDAGLIVDALARDVVTGSNFATIKAGMSYYRAIPSALKTLKGELNATVGAMNFLAEKARRVALTAPNEAIKQLVTDITSYIDGGALPTPKWRDTNLEDNPDICGASTIWENKAYIQEEVIEHITQEFPEIEYDEAKCRRDVGYIVDALRYDLSFGGEYATYKMFEYYYYNNSVQLGDNELEATLAAYDYVKFVAMSLAINSVSSPGALQTRVEPKLRDESQLTGDAGTFARVEELMTALYNNLSIGEYINRVTVTDVASNALTTSEVHNFTIGTELIVDSINGELDTGTYYVKTVPTSTTFTLSTFFNGPEAALSDATGLEDIINVVRTPDLSNVTANFKQQFTNIQGSKSLIQEKVTDYIVEKFPTLVYNQAKCERDVGLIIDAVGKDMLLDTNYLTTIAALSYYRGTQADVVIKEQRLATVQAYRELKNFITTYVSGEGSSVNYGGRNDNSSVKVRVNNLMNIVINIIEKGAKVTPEMQGTVTYFNDRETINAVDALKVNKDFLGSEATAWIKANFGGEVTDIVGSPGALSFSAPHNLEVNDPVVFSGTVFGGIEVGVTYYVSAVPSANDIQLTTAPGEESINTFTGGSGSMTASYAFDETACKRDMASYIDSIIYDLQYPGNYHSLRAARLYVNAVEGSQYSDMFYVRNATGARNMTFNGLLGNLSEKNQFGTRRPTGGAYVSLDPGFGPWDTEAWVTNKSCYVQNVSTFGTGCIGNKIDGSLHAGGNRSVVSNDFTQILSDGIGVWCSGNNSLTELVSVFAYYNYAGYIADFGGRIRATNGNSSYGTFGVIAEGTDLGEEPIVADVDNLSQNALVYSVSTDGEEEVLAMEYSNAGTGYTNAQYAISGNGFNAATVGDEFRDQAVVEARIIDVDDGNGTGGEDYVIAQNVAQGGDKVSITLAATDFALGDAYNGMRAQVTAGTGVGQYGNIINFNNGTKKCTVFRPSFDNLTVTATSATGNVITVADTTTLYVDMPVYFDAAIGGLDRGDSPSDVYYITNILSSTTFTVSDSVGGVNITLTNTTGQSVTMYAAGFDNIIPGKPSEDSLDLTTGYTVEPAIVYAKPGFTAASISTADAIDFGPGTFADGRFIAIEGGAGASTNYSLDGETWATGGALPASANWSDVVFGGGQGATARAVIGGLGGTGAVLEAELGELNSIGLPGPTQIARVNVIQGGTGYITPPTIVFTSTLGGGGATAVATVKDGAIQNIIITSTGAGYAQAPTVAAATDKLTEVIVQTRGRGYQSSPTVTITGGGASTQAQVIANLENEGVTAIRLDTDVDDNPLFGEGYTTTPTVTIVDDDAKWVAIADGSTTNAYLPTSGALNANWTAGNPFTASHYVGITHGTNTFVAVGSAGSVDAAQTSTDGISWTPRTMTTPASGTFSAVRYGAGRFVAINTDGFTAVSVNGILWEEGGNMPSALGDWISLAWGNGRFVAISSIGEYAISYDFGANWYSESDTLNNISATGWTRVAYGQGLFMAVCDGASSCAISSDGLTWNEGALSGTASWSTPIFGNPNSVPVWVALTSDAATTANKIKTGARAHGRCYAEDGALIATTLLEPGSGYPEGSIVSITSPNTIALDSTDNMYVGQPITFEGADLAIAALNSETLYYVSDVTGNTIEVSLISGGASYDVETIVAQDIAGSTFQAGPLVTVTDPSSTVDANVNPRIRNGVLGQPTFTNRGSGYSSATTELGGDGNADLYQPSTFIAVRNLFELPEPGSNVEFANIPEKYYKLVTISNVIGQEGSYTATFQISPGLDVLTAPKDGTVITTTNKYSQVRLTGHDFLYIGTGNKAKTNYPFVDITTAYIESQQLGSGGGRVFYTSTDQDGNFNVGGLFGVQQSTGTATLDADAFNLAGLQSLQINGLGLGIGSAIVTQFSTDPFFTENSDNIVPTQRAIRSYITAQIGGGQSSLNVNTLTAGTVFIANDEITTTSGGQLNIKAKMNFTGGVDGAPVALGYFLSR
jgi:hypothetical protein